MYIDIRRKASNGLFKTSALDTCERRWVCKMILILSIGAKTEKDMVTA